MATEVDVGAENFPKTKENNHQDKNHNVDRKEVKSFYLSELLATVIALVG